MPIRTRRSTAANCGFGCPGFRTGGRRNRSDRYRNWIPGRRERHVRGNGGHECRSRWATSITAKTPSHATGAVNVVVTNTDGQSGTRTGAYTYTPNPAPTVTAISPATGPAGGGTPVTITGTGFLTGATVTFGGTSATGVTVVSATSITATAPAHAAGAVNIVVTNTDI